MKESVDIYYDEEGDYLEVSFGVPPKTEYTEKLDSEVLITRDSKTNEVKSIGIVAFGKRTEILKTILKRLNMSIPLDISISDS
ncbi:hypothetical protein HYT25_03040 [Candidatus Pacearchaeota archaeon]|nr:hypothetical protein [Candidatus Pacearchaeota archaeon]